MCFYTIVWYVQRIGQCGNALTLSAIGHFPPVWGEEEEMTYREGVQLAFVSVQYNFIY